MGELHGKRKSPNRPWANLVAAAWIVTVLAIYFRGLIMRVLEIGDALP